ncbi:hypothetical protein B0H66DRAFT_531649 [Apodospora peruviana]|uniref:Uncharacterized protein n=1 Tax=Apodospora peruviana TaxID=516989 RepID=A0AAE0ICA8_9PEZI|nr:hypothetical protein B0H66DRAFT_531649 [Apodospora peruviana]
MPMMSSVVLQAVLLHQLPGFRNLFAGEAQVGEPDKSGCAFKVQTDQLKLHVLIWQIFHDDAACNELIFPSTPHQGRESASRHGTIRPHQAPLPKRHSKNETATRNFQHTTTTLFACLSVSQQPRSLRAAHDGLLRSLNSVRHRSLLPWSPYTALGAYRNPRSGSSYTTRPMDLLHGSRTILDPSITAAKGHGARLVLFPEMWTQESQLHDSCPSARANNRRGGVALPCTSIAATACICCTSQAHTPPTIRQKRHMNTAISAHLVTISITSLDKPDVLPASLWRASRSWGAVSPKFSLWLIDFKRHSSLLPVRLPAPAVKTAPSWGKCRETGNQGRIRSNHGSWRTPAVLGQDPCAHHKRLSFATASWAVFANTDNFTPCAVSSSLVLVTALKTALP